VPELWGNFGAIGAAIGRGLVLIAVLLCLVRGLPVIVEFVYSERRTILGSLLRPAAPWR
jgi:hypothetical protein